MWFLYSRHDLLCICLTSSCGFSSCTYPNMHLLLFLRTSYGATPNTARPDERALRATAPVQMPGRSLNVPIHHSGTHSIHNVSKINRHQHAHVLTSVDFCIPQPTHTIPHPTFPHANHSTINWHHRAGGTDGHTDTRTHSQQELDFGTIMCWADNVVGQQKEPCVFHLIAAGKPDAPYNCSLVNQTSESLEVDCSEGKRLPHNPFATRSSRSRSFHSH